MHNINGIDASNLIDPSTLTLDLTLQISCGDDDQVISRSAAEGVDEADLLGAYVRFNSDHGEIGAIPADQSKAGAGDDGEFRDEVGHCGCIEYNLSGKTFAGADIGLGLFFSPESAQSAMQAVSKPITLLLNL